MAKKKVKSKHTPLKPTTAWAVVDNLTGEIVWRDTHQGSYPCPSIYDVQSEAVQAVWKDERAEKVYITKAKA